MAKIENNTIEFSENSFRVPNMQKKKVIQVVNVSAVSTLVDGVTVTILYVLQVIISCLAELK